MAGYEGVAIVRTVDPRQGVVALLVAPAFYTTVLDIIQALSQEMPLCLLETADRPGGVRVGENLRGKTEEIGLEDEGSIGL
jgi:hypothetical protein